MPELPEIETIRSDLEHSVLGRRVASVQVFHDALVRAPSVEEFKKGILGRTLRAVTRRGKYLLIHLDDGLVWALHLSLEGRLLLVPSDAPVAEGTKLVVALDEASRSGQLQRGDVILLVAFGGGFTWASCVLRW
jgi:formamidopyrimidine-DNA glycosylase